MDFLKEIFIETFTDGWIGVVLGTTVWLLVLLILWLVLWGVYYLAGLLFVTPEYGCGVVSNKEFTPSHTTTILKYDAATKTSMPQIIHQPDKWEVDVSIKDMSGSTCVSEQFYNSVDVGKSVYVKYKRGRFSKSKAYIVEIK